MVVGWWWAGGEARASACLRSAGTRPGVSERKGKVALDYSTAPSLAAVSCHSKMFLHLQNDAPRVVVSKCRHWPVGAEYQHAQESGIVSAEATSTFHGARYIYSKRHPTIPRNVPCGISCPAGCVGASTIQNCWDRKSVRLVKTMSTSAVWPN
jgi:hypothetical protein